MVLSLATVASGRAAADDALTNQMPRIAVASDGAGFVVAGTNQKFVPWGFNYLGQHGQLAEEDWHTPEGWGRIERDFANMRALGANVVRWHLQFATFMESADQARPDQLERLRRLLQVARDNHLYLDLTGLNCFRRSEIPPWYDKLSQRERWQAQANFWSAVAEACAGDSVVFCYDLMNEPVASPAKEGEHPWVTGELGGFHFVQRLADRPEEWTDSHQLVAEWVAQQVTAIRQHDQQTLTTVGVIPWAFVWPNAKPVFYTDQTKEHLDFVSIHVYPKSGELAAELKALATYDLGKPLVIEEFFPLGCTIDELDTFIDAADERVDGWMSHYFGHTIDEHRAGSEPAGPMVAKFLEYWRDKTKSMVPPANK
jgi:hypothetical protein